MAKANDPPRLVIACRVGRSISDALSMGLRAKLENGQDILGRFWLVDSIERWQDGTPGLLQWTTENGARLRLIGPHEGWPDEVGAPQRVVQGLTRENEPLTLLDAWPQQVAMGSELREMRASTMVAGEHITADSAWDGAAVRTATLHEWMPATGITHGKSEHGERGLTRLEVQWTPPEAITVEMPDATITLAPNMSTQWRYAPDWSIRTDLEFVVKPDESRTLDQLGRDPIRALVAFTIFMSARPDEARQLRLWRSDQTAVPVLRTRRGLEPRDWNPSSGFLVRAEDCADPSDVLRRWLELCCTAEDPLLTFCGSLDEGNQWSPRRLVDVVNALLAYARDARGKRGGGEKSLKALLSRLGNGAAPLGISAFDLTLMNASRNYYAHFGEPTIQGITVDLIRETTYDSARRATALMQACVLQDLGFEDQHIGELLTRHYRTWPLPASTG